MKKSILIVSIMGKRQWNWLIRLKKDLMCKFQESLDQIIMTEKMEKCMGIFWKKDKLLKESTFICILKEEKCK